MLPCMQYVLTILLVLKITRDVYYEGHPINRGNFLIIY